MNKNMSQFLYRFVTSFSLLALLLGVVSVTPAHAATVTVSDCSAPSGAAGRLVEVITAAVAGDTVNFSCSDTIILAATILIDKDLTIDGSGQAVTISGGNAVRVLIVDPGVTVTLNQLTISNGSVAGGGAGISSQGTLTISNSTISNNTATTGGGGIVNSGTLTILNSTISGNRATAGGGGGIYNTGILIVSDSTLSGNSGTSVGGGILNNASATTSVTRSTVSGNSAPSGGGGIVNAAGALALTVADSTFSGNSGTNGGAIQNRAAMSVTNSTFAGNTASNRGGGILSLGGTVTLVNSTFSGNSAAALSNAGGSFYSSGTLHYSNTIFANSTADVECYSAAIGTNTNNLVDDGTCSAGGVNFNTGNPTLGSLANNGGPTQTFAPLAGSPAIDAGDDTTCSVAPVNGLDQRGASRWQGAHCDIGAYEKSPTVVGDCSGPSGYVDRLVEVVAAAPAGDTVTFSCSGVITLDSTLVMDKSLTIDGSGQAVTISGGNLVRVFYINSGVTAALKNLTIADGSYAGWGGGIENDGTLTVANSTLANNSATGGGGYGGGIDNRNTLTVLNSTFSGNFAENGGGAISNAGGTLTMANSTLSGNSASDWGGGIFTSVGTATVTNSTLSGNSATGSGGSGIYIYNGGTLNYANTIIANSTGSGDCYNDGGTIGTNLNNLVEDGSCLTGGVNFQTGDPNLGVALTNNGGPAQTLALLTGSSAIDTGDDTTCSTAPISSLDQRGAPRPVGAHCDIGAFEKVSSIVTNTNDSGLGSLRYAIAYAMADDTITFAPGLSNGVITLASPLTPTRNVTLDGSALAAQISISGDANLNSTADTGDVRVFFIASNATITIDSLKIIHGYSDDQGGGIYLLSGGNLTLKSSTVSESAAFSGGGISNLGGNLTIENSTLSGNSATNSGGGILNTYGGLTPATLTVQNSTLSGNTAPSGNGGAIFNDNSSTLLVVNSTLSGNAASNGGAIANQDNNTAMIRNSTLSGNTATNGGGIYNSSAYAPGWYTTFGFVNTIIANSTSGGDCYNTGTIGTNTNNLVEDGSCSAALSGDPNLGPFANNGGSTQTFALLPGSPAIDAGNAATCAATPINNYDQRGATRPTDGDASGSAACDIGAFELGGLACGIQSAVESTDYTFLGNVTLRVTDDGTNLECLRVTDIPYSHPSATNPLKTGKYWQIAGLLADRITAATANFSVNLTLPFGTADANDNLCRYTGSGWDCAASGYAANTSITRNNIAQFSDWTIGDNSGPTAVGLARLTASATADVSGLGLALLGLLVLGGVIIGYRTRRTHQP